MIPGIVAVAGLSELNEGISDETYFDFVSGLYLVEGIVYADINDQIGTGDFYGPFNDAQIELGVGLKSPVEGTWLAETRVRLLSDFSVLIEFTWEDVGANPHVEMWKLNEPDFTTGHYFRVGDNESDLSDFDTTVNSDFISVGANKIAATFSADKLALSVNGATAVSIANPVVDGAINAASLLLSGNPTAIIVQAITILSPVSDEELAILSAVDSA